MTEKSLKYQALHGAFWSFIERFGLLGVQLIVSLVLARLLSPAEFGLLGMITVFTLLGQVVVESGFGQALIQKQDCTATDISTAFWFNLMSGSLMTLILYLCSPLIAHFYGVPLLENLTKAASLNMFINSFGVVQNALMQKEMQFKKRTIASLSAIIVSGIIGIALALKGFGVWALIIQILLNNLSRIAIFWLIHPWRPIWTFSTQSFRILFRFGSNMLFSGLTNCIFNNIYLIIIGKLYSASSLGYYQRAKEFILASSNSISQVAAQVNFPVMAKLQDSPTEMRNAFRKILQNTLFIITPSMIGLGVIAPNLIPILLGEKWIPSVPFLKLLCIIGALFPIHLLNLNILQATGRSDIYFRLEIIKKILTCISITVTHRYGILALLWGQIITNIIGLFLNSHFTHTTLGYSLLSQIRDNIKMLASCVIMGTFVWLVGSHINLPQLALLFIQILGGAGIFILSAFLFRDPVIAEWRTLLKHRSGNI